MNNSGEKALELLSGVRIESYGVTNIRATYLTSETHVTKTNSASCLHLSYHSYIKCSKKKGDAIISKNSTTHNEEMNNDELEVTSDN